MPSRVPAGLKPDGRGVDPFRVKQVPVPVTSAGDAADHGLPMLCAGFAVIHLMHAAITPWVLHPPYPGVLAGVDLGAAAVFALMGFFALTRRMPGWRRDTAVAVVPVIATAVTAVRVELLHATWPGVEFVLAVAAAAVATASRWFWAVVGTCVGLWAASFAASLIGADRVTTQNVVTGLEIGLLLLVTAGFAAAVRRARAHASAALTDTHRQLVEQSVRDPLTGVANRKGLELVAQPMIDLARRQGQAVHCLVIDIDGLRGVNEEHGLSRGDQLLLAVAEGLHEATRSTDVIARWGGDEFVILGPGTGISPLELERRVRAHLATSGTVPRESWQGRVSAGSATLVPWDADDLDGLLHRAGQDMALRRNLRRRVSAELAEDGLGDEIPTPPAGPASADPRP